VLTDAPWGDVEVEQQLLSSAGLVPVVIPPGTTGADEIAREIAMADPAAVLTCWAPVNAAALAGAPHLQVVVRMGVGLDNIDLPRATELGVRVANVPDYAVQEVSDHAVAQVLGHARAIVPLDRRAKAGIWNGQGVLLRRVADLTVGIVGYGRIGKETVRKLSAFACRLLVVSRRPTALPLGVESATLEQLQREADVIVLHAPLTPETTHLVDEQFIAACKRRPFIVNVSRGALVDTQALLEGLDHGLLSGAALDVCEGEPSPPTAVLMRSDIVVTPHVAYLSTASLLELRRRSCEEVIRVLVGQSPRHPCNVIDSTRVPTTEKAATLDTPSASGGETLTGGVSSDIKVYDGPGGKYVVKRALEKLRVQAEWHSDPARSSIEAAGLKAMASLIGQDAVPQVLWEEPEQHRFAMAWIPERYGNWKSALLTGQVDPRTSDQVGALLGRLHRRAADRPDLKEAFGSDRFFQELRIRPYLQTIAERNPSLRAVVAGVIEGMHARRVTWVHGDYSPKNILADGAEVVILDCEVAHWGDPRFDLAFCVSHLVLKSLRRDAPAQALSEAASQVVAAYRREGLAIVDDHYTQILGCLLLSRLEGDSPVDYLADLDVAEVKRLAIHLIQDPAVSLEARLARIPEPSDAS